MSRAAAWALFAATAVVAIAGAVLAEPGRPTVPIAAAEALMLAGIAAIGAVVASREPGNPCGWLVGVIGAAFAATILADHLYERSGNHLAAWVESWVWIPAIVSSVAFAQLFPTGRPLAPRWRWLLRVAVAAGPTSFVGIAFGAGRLEDYPDVVNPLAAPDALAGVVAVTGGLGFACLLVNVFGAIASLVVRFRRSRGVERQQLKWVASAAVLFPVAFSSPSKEVGGDELGFVLLLLALFLMAAAVAVAILRYRLYDIDVVINRALVYTPLTVTLAGAYLVTVLLAQLVLPDRSDLGVAVSTLAVAAAFTPARRRIQAIVDRRFFRRRYDAERTLAAFGTRLRDEVDLALLSDDLRAVVVETVQPAHVTLWLR